MIVKLIAIFSACLENPKLCIVCQEKVEQSKRGRPQKKDVEKFKVFVDVCKTFAANGDLQYHKLQKAIRNKTADDLYKEDLVFHTDPCRNDFQRIRSNQLRSTKRETTKEKTDAQSKSQKSLTSKPARVSRQETVSFDKNLCFVCQQVLPNEGLNSVRQTSRDQTLKDAFAEYPVSLALYKIRTSHAFDPMAGDIKYHMSCWRTTIDHRVPEILMQKTSNS